MTTCPNAGISASTFSTGIRIQFFHMYHHWGRDVDPLLRSTGQMPEYGLGTSQSSSKIKFKMQPTARRVIFFSHNNQYTSIVKTGQQ
jgi:hypothetical protein